MKIYMRKSLVFRHLVLGLLWFGLLAYKYHLGQSFSAVDIFFVLAGILFIMLFYWERTKPYLTIEDGILRRGKTSIPVKDIKEWKNKSGILLLRGNDIEIKLLPSRISQEDRERIYNVLRKADAQE
jgi:uncharacterized membrane protein YdbT with pleckstrin-like domain